MTPETARLLALALDIRDSAAVALAELRRIREEGHEESVEVAEVRFASVEVAEVRFAEMYVHEQRIINRIIHEHRD